MVLRYSTVIVVLYGSIFLMSPEILTLMYAEDGVIEWVAVAAWATATVFYFRALRQSLISNIRLRGFWLIGLCLICILAFGEEISWGQRLFGFNTPSIIENSNLQGEMNLHNLKWLDVRTGVGSERKDGIERWLTFNRMGTLIWVGYLVLLPISCRFFFPIQRLATKLKLPVNSINIAIAAIVSYSTFFLLRVTTDLAVDSSSNSVFQSPLNECKETLIAILFCWSAIYISRHEKDEVSCQDVRQSI